MRWLLPSLGRATALAPPASTSLARPVLPAAAAAAVAPPRGLRLRAGRPFSSTCRQADADASNPTSPPSGPLEQLAKSIQKAHMNRLDRPGARGTPHFPPAHAQGQAASARGPGGGFPEGAEGAEPSSSGSGGGQRGPFVETRRFSQNALVNSKQKMTARRELQNHLAWGTFTTPDLMEFEPAARSRRKKAPLFGPTRKVGEKLDPFFRLGLNPKKPSLADDSYKNVTLLVPYVSRMGKIYPRSQTRLLKGSQRRVAKAIKRARAMLLLPVLGRPHKYNNYGWGDKWTFHAEDKA